MSQKSDTAKSDKRTEMKVYELEQDINEEKPMEDQDPPLPFLLPADMSLPLGAATPLMANFTDCEETTLSTLSYQFDVDHHDLCSDEVLRLLQFPLVGIVYGPGQRLVMPLRVRASHSDKEYVIYFVVDSGAKDVYLSENSYKLLGGGKKFTTVFVQDTYLFCQQAGDLNALWKEVNIIGASFLLKANLSMIISPHPYDYLGEHLRIFYLSKFEEIQNTFALAKSAKLQTPHLKEKASVVELPNVKGLNSFASSDPTNPHKALTLTAIPARGTEKLDSSKSSETS
uniref:Uncharacterized protein n=1 Tax=Panagrolaimus superbus TaxID=310955 RepID=A0A914XYF0_9BILA